MDQSTRHISLTFFAAINIILGVMISLKLFRIYSDASSHGIMNSSLALHLSISALIAGLLFASGFCFIKLKYMPGYVTGSAYAVISILANAWSVIAIYRIQSAVKTGTPFPVSALLFNPWLIYAVVFIVYLNTFYKNNFLKGKDDAGAANEAP